MRTKIQSRLDEPAVRYGVKDGGHQYLCCTNCQAVLMDIWIIRPQSKEFVWKVRAGNCPFCDENPKTKGLGGSDVVEIVGEFAPGGYGHMREDSKEDDIPSTFAEALELDEASGIWTSEIKKAGKNAKPAYRRS